MNITIETLIVKYEYALEQIDDDDKEAERRKYDKYYLAGLNAERLAYTDFIKELKRIEK